MLVSDYGYDVPPLEKTHKGFSFGLEDVSDLMEFDPDHRMKCSDEFYDHDGGIYYLILLVGPDAQFLQ